MARVRHASLDVTLEFEGIPPCDHGNEDGIPLGGVFMKARSILALAFLAVIAVFGLPLAKKAFHTPVRALAGKFPLKRWFVELNGGMHRLIGRRWCNAVYRAPEGMLLSELKGRGDVAQIAQQIADFARWLETKGVAYLYVQAPSKIDMNGTMLPAPLVHRGNERASALLAALEDKGVRALDLRAMLAANSDDVVRSFYRTDHHWNTDATFKVFGVVAAEMARAAGSGPAEVAPYTSASAWEREVWPQCFTGTNARRTGHTFGGKDDLIVYVPAFRTDMEIEVPGKKMRLSGDFRKTVMWNAGKIRTGGTDGFGRDAYSLLYIGGLFGAVRHTNRLAPLKRRVLIVGDSFARPLEAFLSTVVTELVALDQRRLAPDETVARAVETFKPDLVLQLNNPSTFGSDMITGRKRHRPVMFDYGELR